MNTQWSARPMDDTAQLPVQASGRQEAATLEHLGASGRLVLPLYLYPIGDGVPDQSATHGEGLVREGRVYGCQFPATEVNAACSPPPAKKPKVEVASFDDSPQPMLLGELSCMDSDHSGGLARSSSSISSAGVVPAAGLSSPTHTSSSLGFEDQDDIVQGPPTAGSQLLQSTPSASIWRHGWSSGSLTSLGHSSSSGALSAVGSSVTGSVLHTALCALWEDAQDRGLFRYNVQQECRSRVVPGPLGFVAQLNEGRSTKKRPTEFAVDKVLQPFNASKFHFGKANVQEALMQFEAINTSGCAAHPTSYAAMGRQSASGAVTIPQALPELPGALGEASAQPLSPPDGPCLADSAPASSSSTLLMINVSPIEYGHVLLVPRALERLPQQLDAEGLAVGQALALAREVGSSDFRVGYNSLGAFATINHLHFQGYFLPHRLPCERAADQLLETQQSEQAAHMLDATYSPSQSLPRRAGSCQVQARISRLNGYPVRGFVLHAAPPGHPAAAEALALTLGRAASALQAANIPFNLLITDCGARAFLFPQCYAERQAAGQVDPALLDCGVNPATFEIAGHLILKRQEDYDNATEEWACRLLEAVSLDEDSFAKVEALCFGTARVC